MRQKYAQRLAIVTGVLIVALAALFSWLENLAGK
jgi:hypothetical protein